MHIIAASTKFLKITKWVHPFEPEEVSAMKQRSFLSRRPGAGMFSSDFERSLPFHLERLLGNDHLDSLTDWEPAIDIKEEDKEYVVTADIPGVDPQDIDIHLEKDLLTISGKRSSEQRDERNGYRKVERFEGSFYRAIQLPNASEPEKVTARVNDGVMIIHVPKLADRQSSRIKVST